MEFILDNINELAKNNYKYIEITMGKKISNNIFDSEINKKIFDKTLDFFKNKFNNHKKINSKNYYKDNLRLNINEKFQQRCFKMDIIDCKIVTTNKSSFLINFGERKMISIENFPMIYNYDNVVERKIISHNVKNKFYINFTTDKIDNEIYHNISLFMTKKNGKNEEIIKLIQLYLDILEEIFHKYSI